MNDTTSQLKDAQQAGAANGTGRKGRLWLVLFIVVLGGAFVFARLRNGSSQPQAASSDGQPISTPNIRTAIVRQGSIGQYIEALGTVTPLATVNLYSQVSGQVTAVHYTEGQIVNRGDSLIDIDPRPYEAQLQQYQGALERDQALLKQAEIDLARYQEAAEQKAVARQTYEDQLQVVEQYRGSVKNDMGQLQYGQVQLSYCRLISPISGRVGLRLVDPGNTVFSGGNSAIVVITQLEPISVVFNVAEDYLAQVRSQITGHGTLPVDVYDRSRTNRIAAGKLLTLDNQVDTSTGTIRFRAEFENRDLALFPNQFVNARLLVRTLRNQLLVPAAAVQHNGVNAFVYVVRDGVVHLQSVSEIATEGNNAAISGIQSGDVVAITGFDKVQDGARVAVPADSSGEPSSRGGGE
ncbi:MAG TPA: efflux RND transporter periplasmic adaptor subunit [Bryobacteraceae bacterium]|nr:efflux RND transporter periplasmic adaptor subunit [Bryobacteraceae bacterium]